MGETSIPCKSSTRDKLRTDKPEGVSWDKFLNDLLDGVRSGACESASRQNELSEIESQLEELRSSIKAIESRTGSIERDIGQLKR